MKPYFQRHPLSKISDLAQEVGDIAQEVSDIAQEVGNLAQEMQFSKCLWAMCIANLTMYTKRSFVLSVN